MSKIIGDWPCKQPRHADAWSDADARVDLARQLAGNALAMYGHTMAPAILPGNTMYPPDMVSPATGTPGHTHSGGRDGRPLFRTVCALELAGYTPASGVSTNTAAAGFIWTSAPASVTYNARTPYIPVWVPQCDPMSGAYVVLGVLAICNIRTATNVQATDTLTLTVENLTSQATRSVAEDFSDPSTTGIQHLSTFGSKVLPVTPGAINLLRLSIDYDPDSGASSSARTLEGEVMALELGVALTENDS